MRTALRVPAAAPDESPFPEPVRLRLRKRVLALDFACCAALLTRLLEGMGYEEVRPAGRTRLKGYNRPGGGGWDLTATLPAGVGSRRVVIRLKHSPREHSEPDPKPVHQRCVDELRGACLRAGAVEGLLICTGEFSLTAKRLAAQGHSGVAPVRLVDGEELVDLLLAHRIGVRETRPLLGRSCLEMNEDFFHEIQFHAIQAAGVVRPARPGEHRRENVRRENLRRLVSLRVVVCLGGDHTDADDGQRWRGRPRGSR